MLKFTKSFVARTLFLIAAAATISACDSLKACTEHFGNRLLPDEQTRNGAPTRLVSACMYGADVVGPVIIHLSSPEALCQRIYNLENNPKPQSQLMQEISNRVEEMDACIAGAKGLIHELYGISGPNAEDGIRNCERSRGTDGINPALPCD